MVALKDFWLLHGFKPENELHFLLKAVAELNSLLPIFENSGYEGLYRHVMEMEQETVNKILQPLIDRLTPLYYEGRLTKEEKGFWAARAAITFDQPGIIDRGIFSIYFFNLLQLKKGEAIYQPAGLPHAYLEGQNVEIMASSDNVLRGGLTTKHIDVKELLKHVKCEPATVEILKGEVKNQERIYPTPAADFKLSAIELLKDQSFDFSPATAEIFLLVDGSLQMKGSNQTIPLQRGDPAAICFPGEPVKITAMEDARVFRASVP
jgi:mannose-6-phosphate isomerase